MIVVRTVMQAKFGRGGELATKFVEINQRTMDDMSRAMGGKRRWRVFTDLSGTFDNVVFEIEAENLAEWEKARGILFSLPSFRDAMAATVDLVEGGRNELWTLEAEG